MRNGNMKPKIILTSRNNATIDVWVRWRKFSVVMRDWRMKSMLTLSPPLAQTYHICSFSEGNDHVPSKHAFQSTIAVAVTRKLHEKETKLTYGYNA